MKIPGRFLLKNDPDKDWRNKLYAAFKDEHNRNKEYIALPFSKFKKPDKRINSWTFSALSEFFSEMEIKDVRKIYEVTTLLPNDADALFSLILMDIIKYTLKEPEQVLKKLEKRVEELGVENTLRLDIIENLQNELNSRKSGKYKKAFKEVDELIFMNGGRLKKESIIAIFRKYQKKEPALFKNVDNFKSAYYTSKKREKK